MNKGVQPDLLELIKDGIQKIFRSRALILLTVMAVLFAVLIQHLFSMQVIHGSDYQEAFSASIEKTITINGIRGNIYDRNGKLLAYNRLSYTVAIEDSGSYPSTKVKNEQLNAEIALLISLIESHDDTISTGFGITMDERTGTFSYNVSGSTLLRFRADIFGHSNPADLVEKNKLGYNEISCTAEEMVDFLTESFSIDRELYDAKTAFQIGQIRYGLRTNSFQKYLTTTVAKDVSEKTAAAVREHADELEGVSVINDTRRVYNYPECFSGIIGYVGKISTEEYTAYSEKDPTYSYNDYVGKTGIELAMESSLRGINGEQTVYVDNVGKVQSVISSVGAQPGDNIYLTLDADLQNAVYRLLEREIAGVLYNKMVDEPSNDEDTSNTPVYDVYKALLTNNVIRLGRLAEAKSGTVQADVYRVFSSRVEKILPAIRSMLENNTKIFSEYSDEMQEYCIYIITALQSSGVFDRNAVESADETYKSWRNGEIPVRSYLEYSIDKGWIDITALPVDTSYSDTGELYSALCDYIEANILSNNSFYKHVFKYLADSDAITGRQICLILYEQGILKDDEMRGELESGSISPYQFLRNKIYNLEIKPGDLGLDPCSGSCVIMDPKTGTLLACVTYPGYDANRLSSSEDTSYYNELLTNASLPLYNKATQQTTEPGSTFKIVTSLAGLTEKVITNETVIEDEGIYTKQGMNMKCWIYPGNHGEEVLETAIQDSCNYYFAEVGFLLSQKGGEYNAEKGISTLRKYASMFGLDDKTGIEISESKSKVATEQPISAAIGQSNNSYTTVQLARYITAIANQGTVYDLTLYQKLTDADGNLLESYEPKVHNKVTGIAEKDWTTVKNGLVLAIGEHSQFDGIESVKLAGKTGTAEQTGHPDHALFVGYAPYDDPEIAIATRISNAYTSSNACDFTAKFMAYYYGLEDKDDLLNGPALLGGSSGNNIHD